MEATVRLSNASGNPGTSDANPIAGRGMAVKFHLPDGEATDIAPSRSSCSSPAPPRTSSSSPVRGSPIPRPASPTSKLGAYVTEHPEFAAALQKGLPKIAPTISYVTSDYRALHAFGLVDADGGTRWGRYIWEPDEGVRYLTEEEREAASRDYLQEEIRERLAAGTATMHLDFALALEDDPLDDPTAEWEGDRELVRLGTLEVTEVIEDPETPDRPLVFDPMRLTDGIQPSADPILAARPKAYSVSIERRTRG